MTAEAGDQELHALVHGRVQGVFFRQSTEQRARRLRLRGWVRNLPDGETVEVLAQGPRPELEQLLAFLRQGPPGASIQEVEAEWRPPGAPLPGFRVLL